MIGLLFCVYFSHVKLIELIKLMFFCLLLSLNFRSKCSPSQGPCCTTECTLKFGDKCRDDNGCRDPSFCNGGMPQCPPSVFKPNKTICNKEFVCYMGVSVEISLFILKLIKLTYKLQFYNSAGMYWIDLLGLWIGVLSMHSRAN